MRIILLALVMLTAACTETRAMNQPTITEQQAVDRIEELIQKSVGVIEPDPQVELFRPSLNRRICVGATDGGSEARIIVTRSYYLRGIPKDRVVEVAEQVKTHWEKQGHLITGAEGFDIGRPDVSGRSRPDDFLLSLTWTEGDVLGLAATSTCIWPNGTPSP